MTSKQISFINQAKESIKQARQWLDMAMFFSGDEMPDNEFKKIREAYNLVCQANDKL